MDTNLKALKDLYISLGGAESDVADLTASSEVIPLIKNVAGGGGGGGAGVTVINIVGGRDEQAGETVWSLADGTSFSDIADCVFAGEPIFLCADQYPDYHWPKGVYPLTHYSMDGETLTDALFANVYFDTIGQTVMANMVGFKISSDNSVESTYLGGSLSA